MNFKHCASLEVERVKMLKLKQLREISIWFSIFGQTQLVSTHSSISHSTRVLFVAFKVIFVILLLTPLIKSFKETSGEESTTLVLVSLFPFFILLVNIIEIIESWLQTKIFISMIEEIEESLSHLDSVMDMKVCILKFARHFRMKLLFCTILFSFELVINFTFKIAPLNTHVNLLLPIAAIYRNIAIIHIVFFVELMKVILSSVNDQLSSSSSDSVNDCFIIPIPIDEAMLILRRIRIIYSNVWNISEDINKRFGCFLLIVFVNAPLVFVRASIIIYKHSTIFNLHEFLRK